MESSKLTGRCDVAPNYGEDEVPELNETYSDDLFEGVDENTAYAGNNSLQQESFNNEKRLFAGQPSESSNHMYQS